MTAGGTATCTITVENLGPGLAHGALSVDQFVSNGSFSFGSVTAAKGSTAMPNGTCTTTTNPQNGAGTVTCNLGLIDVGHAVVIKVPVTANTPQNINDRVTVSSDSPDPDKTNNVSEDEVNVVAAQADVALAKTCKPDKNPLLAGETATCTIVATNFGSSAASNVVMTDTLVSNGSFSYLATAGSGFSTCTPSTSTASVVTVAPATSGTVTCTAATLAANATATATVTIVSDDSVDVNDMASVTSSTNDPVTANNSVGPVGVSFGASADLGLTKTAPAAVVAGTQLPYTLIVTNNGPSAAVNTRIKDVVPAGVSIVSVSSPSANAHNCGAGVPGDVNQPSYCKFDTIASGGSETMTIVVFVLPGTTGILHNTATASSDATDTNNANDSASAPTTVTQEPGLSVTKADSPDPVAAGADLEYWLTVSNGGPSTATQVVLTDTLPTEVTFQSAVDGNGNTICANSAGVVTCNLGTLSPGTVLQVFVKVKVSASVADGTTISNTTKVVSREDPTGATDTEDTLVEAVADLWIDKVGNFPTGNPSGTIVYNLYVYNKPGCEQNSGSGNVDPADCWNSSGGPSDAQNVVVTDTLPLDPKKFVVQYVSPNCVYKKVSVPHKVTCEVADTDGNPIPLPAGAVAGPFQIQAVVKGSNGTFTNTATVTSTTIDPETVNNTDVVQTTVQGGTGKKGGGR